MTTNWQIFDTKSTIATGLITKVIYGCTVQLENNIERKIGEIDVVGDTTAPGFIAYSELTEEVITGWVKSSLGAEQVTVIETELQNKLTTTIAARAAVTEKNGLPWLR